MIFALLILVIGLVCYALSTNAKVAELGRIAFAAGLFVTLWLLAGGSVRLIP